MKQNGNQQLPSLISELSFQEHKMGKDIADLCEGSSNGLSGKITTSSCRKTHK
ncbi:hypothetical protein [Candidatus Enterococcus ikei]|uniref:Uncharacterized protein n=1 Tax=Candidatus Enterococcus ikei TaxID=2815326 RepID=A0ABS3GY20_9ENTE|nr:hypothetical protein [Enterococcus sp. DIV0869a]MBO0440156.1 hypothetical protein [Enterococcus sp. DIV0869a]